MGIALCHFDLTVRELGLVGIWRQEEPPAGIKFDRPWLEGKEDRLAASQSVVCRP